VWVELTDDYPIYIPNSFTPNYDGLNDVFYVYGQSIIKFELNIYNRWNQKIYSSNDQLQGWDGVYKGEIVKNDTYMYILNYTTANGRKHTKNGYITVLKEDY
jgi:gliding motility-associated-like protein